MKMFPYAHMDFMFHEGICIRNNMMKQVGCNMHSLLWPYMSLGNAVSFTSIVLSIKF